MFVLLSSLGPWRRPLGAAALLVAVLGAASCGPSPGESTEKVLRLALRSEPPSLDPSLATDNVSIDVLMNLNEGLVQYDDELNLVPAVARRWEFSPDGKRLRFYLREDARWSDGVPVTAHDFEYAWKRLLDPRTAAEYAYFLFDIENAYEFNTGKIRDSGAVGVKALSDFVLEVTLKRPLVFFPSLTTSMTTLPLRRDVIERYGERWTDPEHIVTNGPFLLEEWRHEYKLVLKANPDYFGGRPPLDRVIIYLVREPTTELTLYETGELDLAKLPPVAIPRYREHPEYRNLPLLRGYYYGFNVTRPPFDDPRVRRALAHAIDRSQIPRILQGGEVPTASWIPKGMFGYNPEIGPRFDPATARRLLREAGYAGGRGFPPFAITFNSDPVNRLIAQFVQGQWKRHLGLEVTLDEMEWKVFLSRLYVDPFPVFRLGWGADYPDPDNFMNLFTAASGNNNTRWRNPQYDDLIARAALERDPETRRRLYDRAQRLLTEIDAPIISLFIATTSMLVKPYVTGFRLNAMELLYLKRLDLKPREPGEGGSVLAHHPAQGLGGRIAFLAGGQGREQAHQPKEQ